MEIKTYTKIAVDMDNKDLELLRNASDLVTSLIITHTMVMRLTLMTH